MWNIYITSSDPPGHLSASRVQMIKTVLSSETCPCIMDLPFSCLSTKPKVPFTKLHYFSLQSTCMPSVLLIHDCFAVEVQGSLLFSMLLLLKTGHQITTSLSPVISKGYIPQQNAATCDSYGTTSKKLAVMQTRFWTTWLNSTTFLTSRKQ